MVDIKNKSLSASLLGNQGSEGNEGKISQAATSIHALSGIQVLGNWGSSILDIDPKGKAIRAMLGQENQQPAK